MPAEVFAGIFKVQKEHGLADDLEYVGKFLKSISKASSFDMTLMFMDSKEKGDLKEIMKTLKSSSSFDKDLLKDLEKIYNL